MSWYNFQIFSTEIPTQFSKPLFSLFVVLIGIAMFTNFYVKFIRKNSNHVQLLSKFPIIPHIPFLVPTEFITMVPEDILPIFSKWINEYGRAISGWILNRPYILLFKANYVEKILSSSSQINRSDDYDVLIPWGGLSIVTINGADWHARKKLIQPAFHFKNFEAFVDIFNEQAAILVDQLSSEINNKSFDIVPYTKRCALDMICEAGLGEKVHAQTNHDCEFLESAERIGKLISERWLKPYLRINWLWKILPNGWQQRKCLKILHQFTINAVESRIAARKTGESISSTRAAFLDLLLDLKDSGADLPMQTILDESNIFINAGHETTALSIAWALFLIGSNQNVQDRVYEELCEVFGEDDKSKAVCPNDMPKLKFLECCIKETHRLCAPVPIMARKLTQDCELDNGLVIPNGAVTVMSLYHIQRDPDYFDEPNLFKPERFEDPVALKRMHPYSFIPFSAGPRNCIGKKVGELEVKIVLAHVLRNYKLEAMIPFENTRPYPAAVLFPSSGLPIRITPR